MLSVVVVCIAVAACLSPAPAGAQYRPSYAPRPGGFSQELPQYGGPAASSDTDLGNRDNKPGSLPAPGMTNTLEDTQLANRVPSWPRPNQPFWFLNQQHIAQHTGQAVPCVGANCNPAPFPVGPAPQSSFIGTAARTSRG
ncbi:uncharacterized protein LOC117639167 [Thrips palmi]|uniref:Uncharacterized protein LOC117639167 n=1 Tax=Thrips palmi TaxID=161013 RepID=A0A6P8ZGP4_THRPL|nr:uncharacterized protein LOC117639167 [Thrips palmi]